MTAEVIVASTKTPVLEVAKQMATQHKSCILICSECDNNNQKPVGIITESDIVKFQAAGLDFASTTAAAFMSFPLIPWQIKTTLWQAHQFMQQHRIRRLVVVNEAGYLAKIVTQSTLMQVLDTV